MTLIVNANLARKDSNCCTLSFFKRQYKTGLQVSPI
jgi:hypothetical protein